MADEHLVEIVLHRRGDRAAPVNTRYRLVLASVTTLRDFLLDGDEEVTAVGLPSGLPLSLRYFALGLCEGTEVPVIDFTAEEPKTHMEYRILGPSHATSIKQLLKDEQVESFEQVLQDHRKKQNVTRRAPISAIWEFHSPRPVHLICGQVPNENRPSWTNPDYHYYIRLSTFADADTLLIVAAYLRKSRIRNAIYERTYREVTPQDKTDNLVLIGGINPLVKDMSVRLRVPFHQVDGGKGEPDPFKDIDSGQLYLPKFADSILVEDVSMLVRVPHPLSTGQLVIICSGVLTHGVEGAALAVSSEQVRQENDEYLRNQFGHNPYFAILFRTAIVDNANVPPSFATPDTVLHAYQYLEDRREFLEIHP
ncbi:MAG: hypothetical protein LC700_02455 [Actinobacteria bacterium]|nr:hypothetical protein [Actinomycetota bacterium]